MALLRLLVALFVCEPVFARVSALVDPVPDASISSEPHRQLTHDQRQLVDFDLEEYYNSIERSYNCSCAADEYCGRDGGCHSFVSCEDWYDLGHPFYTGWNETQAPLTCFNLDGEDLSFLGRMGTCPGKTIPLLVSFVQENSTSGSGACSAEVPGDIYAPEFGIPVSRKCTAQPTDEFAFVCYDLGPDVNVAEYVQDYVDATTNLTGVHRYWGLQPTADFVATNGSHLAVLTDPVPMNLTETTEFDSALVRRSGFSLLYLFDYVSEFPLDCQCPFDEFCGKDGRCHGYTCEEVFAFGPEFYTGLARGDQVPKLNCTDFLQPDPIAGVCPKSTSGFPEAVKFPCYPVGTWYSSNVPCLFEDGPTIPYQRMCTATFHTDKYFECFDMQGPGIDVALERYIDDTTALGATCTAEDAGLGPEDGDVDYLRSTSYTTCIGNDKNVDCTLTSWSSAHSFDPERARALLLSNLRLPAEDTTTTSGALSSSMSFLTASVFAALVGLL